MRTLAGILALALLPSLALAVSIDVVSSGRGQMTIEVETAPSDLTFGRTAESRDGVPFTRLELKGQGRDCRNPGRPDVPAIHRWIAVDPGREYTVSFKLTGRHEQKGICLYPIQPDYTEDSEPPPFAFDPAAYAHDGFIGQETVVVGARAKLGPLTVLGLTIRPVWFNPRRLVVVQWDRIEITVTSASRQKAPTAADRPAGRIAPLSPYVRGQVGELIVNARDIDLQGHAKTEARPTLLVITTAELMAEALRLESLHPEMQVKFLTVTPRTSSRAIKDAIVEEYRSSTLDSVVICGDETQVALHMWGDIPGDSWLSFVDGDDAIADIGIGRLPAASVAELRLMLDKTARFIESRKNARPRGTRAMLVAHAQEYPQKYTQCCERIRNGANPRELVYTTFYGGKDATNAAVLAEAPNGYAIINYRGHGSGSTWSRWDRRGASFGPDEVDRLANHDENLSVFFNIACSTGAVQQPDRCLAERLLLCSDPGRPLRGAVAVLAATLPSGTKTNHEFDVNLFSALQESPRADIGHIVGLANNRLVQSQGGAIHDNIKMYVLLGDPLIALFAP